MDLTDSYDLLDRALRRLEELFREDRILVQTFFQQLGETIPPWLVPGFLKGVAAQARCNDFKDTLKTACCVDPNGNGPLWS